MTQRPLKAIEAGSIPVPPTRLRSESKRAVRGATGDVYFGDEVAKLTLGSRPTAGQQALDLFISVRIRASQLVPSHSRRPILDNLTGLGTLASPRLRSWKSPGVRDRPSIIQRGYSGLDRVGFLSWICARGPNKASAEGGPCVFVPIVYRKDGWLFTPETRVRISLGTLRGSGGIGTSPHCL